MARQFVDPAAFRASVDQRLRVYARSTGVPNLVVRRQAALERLMVRLMIVAPGRWALKGGLALETRLRGRARASMDMDIDHAQGSDAAREDLAEAAGLGLGDHFSFVITGSREFSAGDVGLATRFRMECAVAGVQFEVLQVDVTSAPPELWEVEPAQRPGLLAAVGLGPVDLLLVPLERQVAEKLHAYTRTYGTGRRSTRPRDLIDLVLIRLYESVDAQRLRTTIHRTFDLRRTHPVPAKIPSPPTGWRVPYRTEAAPLGVPTDLAEAHRLVTTWLAPILAGSAQARWDPKLGVWS